MLMKTISNIDKLLAKQDELGLYIHVPFCHARCAYCDFYSQTRSDAQSIHAYVDALRKMIISYAPYMKTVSSVYFGGGTPSVLGLRLVEVLEAINSCISVKEGAEITVEVNPESLTKEVLDAYRAAGVNRISMGVQACDDDVLKRLGRIHTMEQTDAALQLVRSSGIAFSVDFIVGIPGVDPGAIHSWLVHVLPFKPSHISVYPLSVEEGTSLSTLREFQDIDEDDQAEALTEAWSALENAGFVHYEVSNFARPGCESVHNSSYWHKKPYLGLGPSASSMLMNDENERVRFTLRDDLDSFLADHRHDITGELDVIGGVQDEHAVEREDVMLAMRTNQGVDARVVEHASLVGVFDALIDEGLCIFERDSQHYVPTQKGWMLGNEMFGAIWCANEE